MKITGIGAYSTEKRTIRTTGLGGFRSFAGTRADAKVAPDNDHSTLIGTLAARDRSGH